MIDLEIEITPDAPTIIAEIEQETKKVESQVMGYLARFTPPELVSLMRQIPPPVSIEMHRLVPVSKPDDKNWGSVKMEPGDRNIKPTATGILTGELVVEIAASGAWFQIRKVLKGKPPLIETVLNKALGRIK